MANATLAKIYNSIKDSMYRLIEEQIREMIMEPYIDMKKTIQRASKEEK